MRWSARSTPRPGLAGGFGISSIPTLMVIRDGIILYAQPVLPEPAQEQLTAKARELDMDEVRASVAERGGSVPSGSLPDSPAGNRPGFSCDAVLFRTETAEVAAAVYNKATSPATLRSHAQIAAFFGDWDVVDPGLVQGPAVAPDGPPPGPRDLRRMWIYAGVARHPG